MDDQLGFPELLKGILGSEKKILSVRKDMFHFAMRIDELEELLEQDDIYALLWVNDNIKENGRTGFLLDLENEYIEALANYSDTGSIEGIKKHFMDGMQYVYCYLKGLLWCASAVRHIWEREKAERDRNRKPRRNRSNYGPGDYLSDAARC